MKMNKIQQDVEQYIRHLQSSLDKRKRDILAGVADMNAYKRIAKKCYEEQDTENYGAAMEFVKLYKNQLKKVHKEQATGTRMLKFFENARSFAIALENTK
jgi:hypothetical protein